MWAKESQEGNQQATNSVGRRTFHLERLQASVPREEWRCTSCRVRGNDSSAWRDAGRMRSVGDVQRPTIAARALSMYCQQSPPLAAELPVLSSLRAPLRLVWVLSKLRRVRRPATVAGKALQGNKRKAAGRTSSTSPVTLLPSRVLGAPKICDGGRRVKPQRVAHLIHANGGTAQQS